ncbi:uncharacterized protein LAESUDRAFT_732624 [Laetiporus sulphureus 93-53]|uniref:Uncharacterized protein n=1 Tax=Laetiporus sulphureus 93-53 TaxID=1314785 RepID=A0A165B1Y3_9APHY|nr:uncharacterized protein LAESUDRAFT_732624 [Laetiporus sulphureus 93-53]KZT00078.1 hypothetical protein LAESUDRAFT_732624 [Laetiporus sulphureus 93-53]
MDYDRYDAFLHHIFKETQGDAWFRPNEDNLSAGVALRVDNGPEFRVFPYENLALEPFEAAVSALNPAVAVKVRSAAVHAALAEVGPDDRSIYVDANTRIQIIETMMDLPAADKEQSAAFVRDERVLVVWSDSIDTIIPTCHEFEERLIKLLWRSRPTAGSQAASASSHPASIINGSISGHSLNPVNSRLSGRMPGTPRGMGRMSLEMTAQDLEKGGLTSNEPKTKTIRTWYGKKKTIIIEPEMAELEELASQKRVAVLYAPVYNGAAAGLAIYFMGTGVKTLLDESALDGTYIRFALCVLIPFLWSVSLFFALQIIQNVSMAIGPIAQYHENSKYYSAIKPRPNKLVDNNLPHITIQMPVYKESLDTVLAPSIESIKKSMQTYARQGGTSTIFLNDDGLRLLPVEERDARIAYYANHGIGWVARPKHDESADGFKRRGRFKKASNMNYGLKLSLLAEKHLELLLAQEKERGPRTPRPSSMGDDHRYGMQYQHQDGGNASVVNVGGEDEEKPASDDWELEEKALQLAIDDVYESSGRRFRPWAANGRACRVGEIILIVDSDTIVPEDCLRDAAREMAECPDVGVIQHESDVMQVAHHYWENGIAYFTRRINKCISYACANGEVAPFVGHNAFLRWRAVQDATFMDPFDGEEKFWSESNVSEDFDMAMRLIQRGYTIRWATYSLGGFKEGVSLTCDDELNRWQKYAYGCNELLFNPIAQWWRKGPIAKEIHRFVWSGAPLHYKISSLAYMFSYYGIACSITITLINYCLLGWEIPIDNYYMHSFEIWLAVTVVFTGSGNVGFSLLQYRLGEVSLIRSFATNIMWIPFFFFFFGGLSIPLTQAILAHLFSYNIQWGATIKEVQRSNFFEEIPKILKRFWLPWLFCIAVAVGMIILSTDLVPVAWQINGSAWAVIFPLAVVIGCHILFPIVLNPWLMVFSY